MYFGVTSSCSCGVSLLCTSASRRAEALARVSLISASCRTSKPFIALESALSRPAMLEAATARLRRARDPVEAPVRRSFSVLVAVVVLYLMRLPYRVRLGSCRDQELVILSSGKVCDWLAIGGCLVPSARRSRGRKRCDSGSGYSKRSPTAPLTAPNSNCLQEAAPRGDTALMTYNDRICDTAA